MNFYHQMEQFNINISCFVSLNRQNLATSLSPLSSRDQKITKRNICTKIKLEQF
jgi:hypothetical protein